MGKRRRRGGGVKGGVGRAWSGVRRALSRRAAALGDWLRERRGQIGGAACLAVFLAAVLPVWSCKTIEEIPDRIESISMPGTTGGPVPAFRGEPDIRVRIRKDATSVTLGSGPPTGGSVAIRPAAGGAPVTLPAPVTLTAGPSGLTASSAGGVRREFGYGVDVEVMALGGVAAAGAGPSVSGAAGAPAVLAVDGVAHQATVRVAGAWSEGGGRFDLIAVMPIETYLPGVLSKELFKDWPLETFRAQAVAARSYALHERHRARTANRPFDVENDTSDQVYGGVTGNATALRAARDTRGIVLVWGTRDELLRAYYSSTCGGRAASAAAVWPVTRGFEFNQAAPLQGAPRDHACQGSTLYRWQTQRSDEEMSRRLRAWGRNAGSPVRDVGRVRSVEVVSRNAAERPNQYRLRDDQGATYTLSAEDLRIAMNFRAEGTPEVTRQTRVASGDVQADVWADRVQISGRGFGHGVGMCQWCAKGFADKGMAYRRMLELFYPGGRIKKVY